LWFPAWLTHWSCPQGYDQYPPINPSSRMFEITTEFKTVQSEGLILAVGQHGNYDVDVSTATVCRHAAV